MAKEKPPVPHIEKIGRLRIAKGAPTLEELLTKFEQSGGADSPALWNLLTGMCVHLSGQTDVLRELLNRTQTLENTVKELVKPIKEPTKVPTKSK